MRNIKNPHNFSPCRICTHPYLSHTTDTWQLSKCQNLVHNDRFDPCQCDEFVPKENLEYLEWKYEKSRS